MVQDQINLRKKALPWDGDTIAEFYSVSNHSFYTEKFIHLIIESYHAYLAGCPRAAIIVSGEALFQVICYKIAKWLEESGETFIFNNGESISKDNVQDVHFLYEKIKFNDALTVVKQKRLYTSEIINKTYIIKCLRNIAAHKEFPLLNDWDSDDPRPKNKFVDLLKGKIEIPEGYKFNIKRQYRNCDNNNKKYRTITFACRDYNCGSLKGLSFEDKFAVIQLALVFNVVNKVSKKTNNKK